MKLKDGIKTISDLRKSSFYASYYHSKFFFHHSKGIETQMPICRSCNATYYFTENAAGKLIAVDEASLSIQEYSAIVGKIPVMYNPKKHKLHLLSCRRDVIVDKRELPIKNTLTNNKGKKQNGSSNQNDFFGTNEHEQ